MIHIVRSTRSLPEIERALQDSAARHQFGILTVHDLRQTMKNKGIDLAMDCRIFEVCNPVQAKKVLEANGAVSTALPCRISVYGTEGRYAIATLPPTGLMQAFDSPALLPVAKDVETVIRTMMDEAAGAGR
jgi:uncharacterized protein (DUF302 family)